MKIFLASRFEEFKIIRKLIIKKCANIHNDLEIEIVNLDDNTFDVHPPDIRSINVRNIMKNRLDLAAEKGCDGVEPDNVDGYANDSGFTLSASDQLDFNRLIALEAHARGLSVGLKNDLDQVNELVDDFDFAVNEQCFEFDECELLKPFIEQGKTVLNAEYKQEFVSDSDLRNSLCNDSIARQFSSLILPLDLDDSFRFSCL